VASVFPDGAKSGRGEVGGAVYTELHLKLLDGRTVAIHVDPGFDVDELEYLPGIRAVSLGNLTVLYEGLVYDVRPSRMTDRLAVSPRRYL
jgi:hypothetical protein